MNVKQIQNFMKNLISLLFVLAVATILMSADQTRVITGKVTDSAGSPIAGVSVLVKNTNRGAVTDYNGEYSLTVKPEDKILIDRKSVV